MKNCSTCKNGKQFSEVRHTNLIECQIKVIVPSSYRQKPDLMMRYENDGADCAYYEAKDGEK